MTVRAVTLAEQLGVIGDVVFVQPFFRLLTGGAFGIAEKSHGVHTPIIFLISLLLQFVPYHHHA